MDLRGLDVLVVAAFLIVPFLLHRTWRLSVVVTRIRGNQIAPNLALDIAGVLVIVTVGVLATDELLLDGRVPKWVFMRLLLAILVLLWLAGSRTLKR